MSKIERIVLKVAVASAIWVASLVMCVVLFPIGIQNIQVISGGTFVKVDAFCNNQTNVCVYVRTETPPSVFDIPVQTIWWTRTSAERPNFGDFGIECDPGATIDLSWPTNGLQVSADQGECRERGSRAKARPVVLVNK